MPEYLQAKDLILQIIGEITVAGATYKARGGGWLHLMMFRARPGWDRGAWLDTPAALRVFATRSP